MRKLTIKREKRFVACLGKMKVYIEDGTANDIKINGVSCRKLGTLKNGEEKTFEISNEAAKVFVIFDKLSKGYCNDYYQLPSGEEDVILTGKNEYNPATGNAFRFDGVTDEEVLANRRKGTSRGIIVLAASVAICFMLGIFIGIGSFLVELLGSFGEDQTFSSGGVSITLGGGFEEMYYDDCDFAYESSKVGVYGYKYEFAYNEGLEDYTVREYIAALIELYEVDASYTSKDGLEYFVSTYTDVDASYYTFVFKTDDAFWEVEFVLSVSDAQASEEKIFERAKSITFE